MRQYPHTLTYTVHTAPPAYVDEDGNTVQPEGTDELIELECHMDHPSTLGNGGANTIPTKHGSAIEYSFLVYMPVSAPTITEGVAVRIWDGEELIGEGEVKQYFKGRLNTTVWV